MTTYVLDTDILTLTRALHLRVLSRIGSVIAPDRVVITAVNIREVMEGWVHEIARAGKVTDKAVAAYEGLRTSSVALWGIEILPTTAAAWGRFLVLDRQKLNVGKDDLRIAAIALEAGATVVTRNLRDFRPVPGLACEDWAV